MNEYNIYQMVLSGSLGLVLMLLAGLILSWILTRGWRFVNRDKSTEPSWLEQELLDAWHEQGNAIGEVLAVTIVMILLIPQILALLFMYLSITLPIALAIGVMFLARYVVDNLKLFNTHVKDVDAHKVAKEEGKSDE